MTWDELYSGMRFERERLVSGVYSASGAEMPLGMNATWPFSVFSAFSFAEEKIRFDHHGKDRVWESGELKETDRHRVICLLPDRTYHFSDQSRLSLMLNIVGPGILKLPGHAGTRGFLDPRCLGLITIDETYSGIRFPDVAEKFGAALTRRPMRIADEGDGVYRVWGVGFGGRDSLWIDAKRGFTLVRRRTEMGRGDEATGEFVPLSEVVAKDEALRAKLEKQLGADCVVDVREEIEIDWIEVGGVWVPKSYRHRLAAPQKNDSREPGDPPSKIVRREMTMAFNWASVNAKLDDDLFDYHSFNLPTGTTVVDRRGPEPVFGEEIGSRPVVRQVDVPPKRRFGLIVAANVVALVALAIGYVVYRRYRRSARMEAQG